MNAREAEELLEDAEVIPLIETAIVEAKRIHERCLEADIPVMLGGCDCGKGCAPRARLLAREEDAPRVAALLRAEWTELALREGTVRLAEGKPAADGAADPDADPPCPACGCTQPLVDGACPECGLTLE